MSIPHDQRRRWIAFAFTAGIAIALIIAMCLLSGADPFVTKYPSYRLQAQAWLRGETALDRDYKYLELAVYNGRYYVSFPPVPVLPNLLLVPIFGDRVPGGLLQKLYLLSACLLILSEFLREKRFSATDCITWAILLCFGCALFPITLVGGVWFEAQLLAFLCAVGAICAVRRRKPTLACICYALAVGCRPLTVCMGPALLALHLKASQDDGVPLKTSLRRLIPGILCGLAIAAAYGWYNWIRFGDPLEFGYKYLPEHARTSTGQMSLQYFARNFRDAFFGKPFTFGDGTITFSRFGFCMFLSSPILICETVWLVQDIVHKRMTYVHWVLTLSGCLHLFLLLLHHTVGGFQFGFRYSAELIPYAFAWLLARPERHSIAHWEVSLLTFGLVFNLVGGALLHV